MRHLNMSRSKGSARAPSLQRSSQRFSEGVKGSIKLFVDGLDKNIKYGQVRKLFESFGKVLSVFVPWSCKRGRRANFGFVLFQFRKDGLEAMRSLHGTRLNRFFLSINPARFVDRKCCWNSSIKNREGKPSRRKVRQEWRQKINAGVSQTSTQGRIQGTRKVWRVKKPPEPVFEEKNLSDKHMRGDVQMNQVKVGLNVEIQSMVVASLFEVLSCEDVEKWLKGKGFSDIKVKPFGAKEKVFEFSSKNACLSFMMNKECILGSLCHSLEPVSIKHSPKGYLVWLKLWKIPIGLWSEEFISKVVSTLGSLVCLDDETSCRKRFDVARALIISEDPILENQLIPITFDDVDLNILVEIDYIFHENMQFSNEEGNMKYDESLLSDSGVVMPSASVAAIPSDDEFSGDAMDAPMAGTGDMVSIIKTLDGAWEEAKANDVVINESVAGLGKALDVVCNNWSRDTCWNWEMESWGPIDYVCNGWDSIHNRFRIRIPTEGFNLLFFGSNFPVNPGFVLGRSFISTQVYDPNQVVPSISNIDDAWNDGDSPSPAQIHSNQIESIPAYRNLAVSESLPANISCMLDDEEVLKKAKQGISRSSKLKSLECLELDCAKPGQSKKKRGRKPKSEVGPSILREISEGSGGVDPELVVLQETAAKHGADKYLTRATKVWLLGKSAGLVFPGSDEEAIRGLAKELEEDQHVFEA